MYGTIVYICINTVYVSHTTNWLVSSCIFPWENMAADQVLTTAQLNSAWRACGLPKYSNCKTRTNAVCLCFTHYVNPSMVHVMSGRPYFQSLPFPATKYRQIYHFICWGTSSLTVKSICSIKDLIFFLYFLVIVWINEKLWMCDKQMISYSSLRPIM